jgi:hypothetical protein
MDDVKCKREELAARKARENPSSERFSDSAKVRVFQETVADFVRYQKKKSSSQQLKIIL